MAGGQPKRKRAGKQRSEAGPGDHAKEAVAEWGKALRLARAAASPVARKATAKVVKKASARRAKQATAGAGSGLVQRLVPDLNGNGSDPELPLPIQESIEVAVPIRVAYALATRFEDYPRFADHVDEVEVGKKNALAFEVSARGAHRRLEVEILDERPQKRIEWQGTSGSDHVGIVSFHELAPGLTHIELSVDLEPHGLIERLTRTTHLTERAIRSELHRFKAYAELWQDDEDVVPEEDDEKARPDDGKARTEDADDRDDEPVAEDDSDDGDSEPDEEAEADEEASAEEDDEDFETDEDADEAYEEDDAESDADEAYEDEEPVPVEAYAGVEPAPPR
jgi:uncharacterized membrane protein